MEKINERALYEGLALHNAYLSERDMINDEIYGMYHTKCYQMYGDISLDYSRALGFEGTNIAEFKQYLENVKLTPEQANALMEIRKKPLFIKILGENALKQKEYIENLLGVKITEFADVDYAGESMAIRPFKTEEEIDKDFEMFNDILFEKSKNDPNNKELYDGYSRDLDYIQAYYISSSKLEQIPLSRITDDEILNLEEEAMMKGTSVDLLLAEKFEDLKYMQQEVQDLYASSPKR